MPTITLTTPDLWLNGPSTVRSVWSPTVSGLPYGAIINSVTLTFYNGHTYASPGYSEVFWGTEPLVAQRLWYCYRGTPDSVISLDLTGRVTGNGTFSLLFYKTQNDDGSNANVYFSNVTIVIDYTNPVSTFTLSSDTVEAGSAISVSINRVDSNYRHNVSISFGENSYSVTGALDSASYIIPLSWLNQIPNATSGTGVVTVETLDGNGGSLGSISTYLTITAGPEVVPTVGTITTHLMDGLDGLYIQGHSRCMVAVSGYAAGTGAKVASVLITGGGDSAWADTMTTGLLRTAGTVTFTVTVRDSRGRETSGNISITVEAYTDMAITGRTALRCLSDGTVSRMKGKSARLGCSYAMTAVGSNAATVRVYWRVYGEDAWTEIAGWNSASGYTAVALVDEVALDERYEILFQVEDKVSLAEQTAVIEPGSVFMVWSKVRQAFGFGAYPTGEKQVAIAEDWTLMLGSTDVGNAIRQRDRVQNLLDNSDFRSLVNQRGESSYSGAGYGIDRWLLRTGATLTVNSGSITLTGTMVQRTLNAAQDRTYTLAACTADGDVQILTTHGWDSDAGCYYAELPAGTYLWAALYEGEYTAGNLPAYVPRGYGAEQAECMRYFRTLNVLFGTEIGSVTRQLINYTPAMRVIPSASAAVTSGSSSTASASVNVATDRYIDISTNSWGNALVTLSADL